MWKILPNLLDFDSLDVLTFRKVVLQEQEENATLVFKILEINWSEEPNKKQQEKATQNNCESHAFS